MPPELPNPVRIPWPRSPRREGRNQIVDAYVDDRAGPAQGSGALVAEIDLPIDDIAEQESAFRCSSIT